MSEDPGRAIRSKPDSSMVKGMKAVAHGKATAFFSAGNSGAVMVGSVLIIGRLRGIERPAIGTFLPTRKGSVFCLDIGANVDCKAHYLYQFALMGHAYLHVIKGIKNPRIGLLSNGHEPYKGPTEIKKAYEMLSRSSLNFVGNIEARDIGEDTIDLLVCDGFVGNVLLKTMQGVARTMFGWIKDEAERSWTKRCMIWLNRSLFTSIKNRADYAAVGGALLLGVNQPIIVAHGSSDARAIENGIKFAYRIVQEEHITTSNALLTSLMKDKNGIHPLSEKIGSLLRGITYDFR